MASRCDDVSPLLAEKNSEEADYAAVRPAENRPTTSRTTQRRMPTSGSANNGRQKDEASGRVFARVSSSPLQDSGRSSSPSGGFPNRRRQYPFVPIQNTDRFMASQYEIPSASVDAQAFSADEGIRPRSTRMSSHLPPLVERILGKLLGIRRRGDGRNIVGTIAYSFTVLTALFFAVPGLWYTVYDIKSKYSSTTVLIGSFQIIIGFVWAVLGIYSHQLARRLFSNKNFADCVRLHSKTFLKIGVSWHTLVLGIVVVSANCYSAWDDLDTNNCRNAQVEAVVCEVFYAGRVTYAVFTLFWNFLVAYVLFSVCRTHTISLRRFQQLLMLDARLYEEQCHQHALNEQKETERTSFLSPQGLDARTGEGETGL